MIKLTQNDATFIYFNPSQICYMFRSTNGDVTFIATNANSNMFRVVETPQQIIELINTK